MNFTLEEDENMVMVNILTGDGVAYFNVDITPSLAKPPLDFNGCLAKFG